MTPARSDTPASGSVSSAGRDDDRLRQRYGRHTSPRRTRWLWSFAGLALLGLIAGWFIWANPLGWGPHAVARDTGFTMTTDTVTVSFDLSVTAGYSAACAIQALGSGFSTVGWRVVTFPAGDGATTRQSVTVRVIDDATTGLVEGCWLT